MASTLELLRRLVDEKVEFVLVGGMAATVHGSSVVTQDVDVCTRFTVENAGRLLRALEGLHPVLKKPGRPPLTKEPSELVGWKNLYVLTDLGPLDFLGQITGVGAYETVARGSTEVDLGGFSCRVMGLSDLIASKRALGRPKDLQAVRELEAVEKHLERKK